MRVLSIGSDRSLFNPHSESAARQIAYGNRFDELDIVVFSRREQKLAPLTLVPGVHIHPTASRSRLWYVWDAFRIARKMARPDVVTVQDPFESGITGVLIARWHRVPLHVQVHTDLLDPAFARLSFLNRLRMRVAGIVFRRAARIRVVSERVRAGITECYQPKALIAVLPIFVDIARFRNVQPGQLLGRFAHFRKKILIVSRLEKEKNVTLAIASFKKTAPEKACLIVVGDGSERKDLERMAPHSVFFEGFQDPAPYYALADLVLVPSVYEGYGMAIVEALAAGKPVLATDVGIAREAGAIIATPEGFAAALARWFEEGPRTAPLKDYPYASFEAYVAAYCDDIGAVMTTG